MVDNENRPVDWLRIDDLSQLADLTQQLYLNLPSFSSWLEEKRRQQPATAPLLPIATHPPADAIPPSGTDPDATTCDGS
jgi:hypothetical protein